MTEVFLIRNQHGHYWGKAKAWVDGHEARAVYRARHQDEARASEPDDACEERCRGVWADCAIAVQQKFGGTGDAVAFTCGPKQKKCLKQCQGSGSAPNEE
jgi:hypothetical protein